MPETARVASGVEVFMPTLLLTPTLRILVPVELLTLKGSRVVVPWMLKEIADEVALTPETVPLSRIRPWARVLAPFHMETKPGAPEPIVVNPVSVAEIVTPLEVEMVMLEPAFKFHRVA